MKYLHIGLLQAKVAENDFLTPILVGLRLQLHSIILMLLRAQYNFTLWSHQQWK